MWRPGNPKSIAEMWKVRNEGISTTVEEIIVIGHKAPLSAWYDHDCQKATLEENEAYQCMVSGRKTRNAVEEYRKSNELFQNIIWMSFYLLLSVSLSRRAIKRMYSFNDYESLLHYIVLMAFPIWKVPTKRVKYCSTYNGEWKFYLLVFQKVIPLFLKHLFSLNWERKYKNKEKGCTTQNECFWDSFKVCKSAGELLLDNGWVKI